MTSKTFYRVIKPLGFSYHDYKTFEEAVEAIKRLRWIKGEHHDYWVKIADQCGIEKITQTSEILMPAIELK